MPKVQRIFEQEGEVCVSLGKIEGQGNLVFLTEEERQKLLADERDDALKDAAWSAHCWVSNMGMTGVIQQMCPADISCGVRVAIMAAEARPTMTRELADGYE